MLYVICLGVKETIAAETLYWLLGYLKTHVLRFGMAQCNSSFLL